jgi:hypothetical protein
VNKAVRKPAAEAMMEKTVPASTVFFAAGE